MTKAKRMNRFLLVVLLSFIIASCADENHTPKPIGYHRIDFPTTTYNRLELQCPYSFDYSARSLIDTVTPNKDCWLNIHYPQYSATIHFTYNQLNDTNLVQYMEESHKLAMKHTVRADNIEERSYQNQEKKVYGVAYDFEGNTATSFQFFLTDSNRHFVRGSLYFNLPPNADSLHPVAEFIKTDIVRLIESFSWTGTQGMN